MELPAQALERLLSTWPVARLATAQRLLAHGPVTEDDLFALTREPETICQRATEPYNVESSGAAVMRPRTGDFWACWGRPVENDFGHLSLAGAHHG